MLDQAEHTSFNYSCHYLLFIHEQYSSPLNIRKDLRAFLKFTVSCSSRIFIGSKFHSLGPTCENALTPYLFVNFVSRKFIVRLDSAYSNILTSSFGALSCKQLCTIKRIL